MSVSLYIRDMPEDLRDRVKARAAANWQSINSLTDLIEREMQLPTLDDWLDGLDDLPKLPEVTTDEIVGVIREIGVVMNEGLTVVDASCLVRVLTSSDEVATAVKSFVRDKALDVPRW